MSQGQGGGRKQLGRVPVEPLARLLGSDLCVGRGGSDSPIPGALGVTYRTYARYLAEGVPVSRADDLACRLGLNPIEIWGLDWWLP